MVVGFDVVTEGTGLEIGFDDVIEASLPRAFPFDPSLSGFFSFEPSAFFGGLAERTGAVGGFDVTTDATGQEVGFAGIIVPRAFPFDPSLTGFFSFEPSAFLGGLAERTGAVGDFDVMTEATGLDTGFADIIEASLSDFFSFEPSAFFGGLPDRTGAVGGFDVMTEATGLEEGLPDVQDASVTSSTDFQ